MDGLPLIATNVPVRAVGDGVGDLADFVVVPNDEFDDDAKKDATATKLLATSSSPSLVSSFPPPEVEGAEFLDLAAPAPSASPSPLSPASSIAADACDAPSASDVAPEGWDVPASSKSRRTHNPIRAVVDPVASGSIKCGKERGDGKDQISLALGDPTAYGTFPPCPALIPAVAEALSSPGMAAGYVDARGAPGARRAIAKFHSTSEGASDDVEANVDADDVIVANGASGALELALTALLDEGSVLLVPRPGFPLYQVIAESHGARVRHYDLLPDRGWEVDLDHVRRIVEEEERSAAGKVVRGIVVNNPSNPTGAVYSREHLREIVALAGRHKVPIVADEIYGDMTFDDAAFRPMAEVAAQLGREVPVIAASGLGKQYLVPGWRVGWIVFHDNRHGSLRQVKEGARRLAQVVLGASHLAQVAVPAVLDPPSDEGRSSVATWKAELYRNVEKQAKLLCGMLDYECCGLDVISPQGAMYAMVRIDVDAFDDCIVDDVSFMGLLLEEENVVVLPGRAFGLGQGDDAKGGDNAHAFRVAFCAPKDVLREAAGRIASFCFRHARK